MVQAPLILQIAVPGPFAAPLDYLPPPACTITLATLGHRVKVPLRNKEVIGILVGLHHASLHPHHKLKTAVAILDETPLFTPPLLKLTQWASEYYHHPLGEVMAAALPTALRQTTPRQKKITLDMADPLGLPLISENLPTLNSHQQHAFNTLISQPSGFCAFLLYGVTGSGKTEVYLRAIAVFLKQKKQILILVPEIGLTPQTVQRFKQRFNAPIVVLHSSLNDTEKLTAWLQAKENKAAIVIGTRSAIFTPLPHLGLIIIDEEHDLSFKQQEGFRYSAKDTGLMRAQLEKIPIILGSATPSLESLYNVAQQRYQLLTLPTRAGDAHLPTLKLIDARKQSLTAGLSASLLAAMKKHLDKGNQVLLFLNRRGFAPSLLCHACGFIAQCHRCDARLTYHRAPTRLRCHHCHYECPPYTQCPKCQAEAWILLGQGTQKLETTLQTLFPDHAVIRIDRDNTRRKDAMKKLLEKVHQGESKILVGTQMLAKGHHFPDVTLVAILDIDIGLSSSDFRATERMAQLIIQVAGRSGRAAQAGEVCIQTHFPEHPLLNLLLSKGYLAFADQALQERNEANLPPHAFLALLRAQAMQQTHPLQFLQDVKALAKKQTHPITILGPIAAPMEKRAGQFRAQLAFQATKRSHLHTFLNTLLPQLHTLPSAKKVRYNLDVDPQDML